MGGRRCFWLGLCGEELNGEGDGRWKVWDCASHGRSSPLPPMLERKLPAIYLEHEQQLPKLPRVPKNLCLSLHVPYLPGIRSYRLRTAYGTPN